MNFQMHSWFLNAEINTRAKLRLFCFPYAGAGASVYRNWRREIPQEIEVCPVQLPGRESRALERPMESASAIVDRLVSEMTPLLHTPFAFFGHSMGALLAFETARQLYRKHRASPIHIFASGKTAPHLSSARTNLHRLPDDPFKEQLRLLQGTPEAILQNDEMMQLLMPRLRADFAICENYTYAPGAQLTCPITAFGGTRDDVKGETLLAWKELTRGHFEQHWFEGNHFFLHEREREVIDQIVMALKKPAQSSVFAGMTVL